MKPAALKALSEIGIVLPKGDERAEESHRISLICEASSKV